MRFSGIIWLDTFVDKLVSKHGVYIEEVEELFLNNPFVTRIERGTVYGEDLDRALGRSDAGRYLAVFFVLKRGSRALVISARDLNDAERGRYVESKK